MAVLVAIEYGKELTDTHVEAGLLTYFSYGGAAWCIAHVDPPARHGPAPVLYIAHKQNLVLVHHGRSHSNLRSSVADISFERP